MLSRWVLLFGCVLPSLFGASATIAPLRVVTLHSVLTEIAREIGGEAAEVRALVRPGVDPHVYEPTPADIRTLQTADVILAAGLGLESYLPRIAKDLTPGVLVEAGTRLPAELKLACTDHAHPEPSHGHAHRHGEIDPHWWHGIEPVLAITRIVESDFAQRRLAQAAVFARNADAYRARLHMLQGWARQEVAQLPPERRILVTSHDAFGYLAREHGFILHPLLGTSTANGADARQLALVISLIKKNHIKAVFAERSSNPRLIETVVRETGAILPPPLSADGLSTEPAFATYDAMMRTNLRTIVEALR